MWKLRSRVTHLSGVIKWLVCGELFRQFHLQNCQKVDEIGSAGKNLSMELDSRANHWNQTKVLPEATTLKWKAASSEQTV